MESSENDDASHLFQAVPTTTVPLPAEQQPILELDQRAAAIELLLARYDSMLPAQHELDEDEAVKAEKERFGLASMVGSEAKLHFLETWRASTLHRQYAFFLASQLP